MNPTLDKAVHGARPPGPTAAPYEGVLKQLWFGRWPILGLTAVAVGAGLAYSLMAAPTYRATTSLLIEPKEANVVEIDKVYETQGIVREYHRTQY